MEVITTREPPGTGTDFEVGQVEERFEQFLPTSAQFPAFFSVLKMASESAKSRKNRDFSCFFGSGLWKNCYLGVITTRESPKTGSGFQIGKVKELPTKQFLDPNSSLPKSRPGSGSTRSLWKRKNKVKSVFFSERHVLSNTNLRH